LKHHYSQYKIGFSDHTVGISAPVAAVAMGAEIVEKHITIDRRMKGTDQAGSLGPDGLNRLVRDIRLIEMFLGKEDLFIPESVQASKHKLERSIASKRFIRKGEIITLNDIHLLSPGDGFKWHEKDMVIGTKAKIDINMDEIIYPNYIS
jgi:sialic acid synthase